MNFISQNKHSSIQMNPESKHKNGPDHKCTHSLPSLIHFGDNCCEGKSALAWCCHKSFQKSLILKISKHTFQGNQEPTGLVHAQLDLGGKREQPVAHACRPLLDHPEKWTAGQKSCKCLRERKKTSVKLVSMNIRTRSFVAWIAPIIWSAQVEK